MLPETLRTSSNAADRLAAMQDFISDGLRLKALCGRLCNRPCRAGEGDQTANSPKTTRRAVEMEVPGNDTLRTRHSVGCMGAAIELNQIAVQVGSC